MRDIFLKKAGYDVTIANDGIEGVQTYKDRFGFFDLILMDVRMPNMDGLEATRRIRELETEYMARQVAGVSGAENSRANGSSEKNANIPIIAITAQTMKGDREKCLDAGMDDYIAKPIKRNVVLERIRFWLPEDES